jgi:hypothetical protein
MSTFLRYSLSFSDLNMKERSPWSVSTTRERHVQESRTRQ